MKKINAILNVVIGAFVGVFIGRSIYVYWDFKTHPDLYAAQSAPWYTSILVSGAFTVIVVLLAFIIKLVIRKYMKKD